MTTNQAIDQAKTGQFIVVDPQGHWVRTMNEITSWCATTYKKNADGTVTRVA